MATYTSVQAIASNFLFHMCTDGVGNLYVIGYITGTTTIKVWRYNILSDTLTDISANTFQNFHPGTDFPGPHIEWWNDDLYCTVGIRTVFPEEARVYRWNGGTSWTEVDSGDWSGILTLNGWIEGDGDRLTWIFKHSGVGQHFRASTDGTAWAAQTTPGEYKYNLYYDKSQRDELVVQVSNTVGPDRRMCSHQAGNNWTAVSAADIGLVQFLGTEGTYQFVKSLGTVLYRSTNWLVGKTVIAGTWYTSDYPCIWDLTYEIVATGLSSSTNRDQVRFWNAGTLTFDLDGTPNAGSKVMQRPCYYAGSLYVLVDADGIYVRDDPIGPASAYSPSPNIGDSADAMDVSPDDYYLHIGAITGGNPVEIRMLADLTVDAAEMYAPGAGDCIVVKCGDLNESWVWIAGDFGTPKVRASIDDGATWVTKDPGGWGDNARPIVVGPDWDDLVLVPSDGDDDLHETEDGGLGWVTLNAGLPFDVGGMDRLDINLDEIIIGDRAARSIRYSPNNGGTFADISEASMQNVGVTDLIIG